ncbi:MAG: hypothetical protein CMM93_00870 [Rickettsiales bacterium]|nr:hypothetical protein [Rickettsiales bacterium]
MNERYMREDELFLSARQIESEARRLNEAVKEGRFLSMPECITLQKAALEIQELFVNIRLQQGQPHVQ